MKMLCNSEVKIYGFFLFFSIFALFFYSQDSYLYDLYNRVDSAWFFMCGKAWMNGMVPYVDFADSKGPLLWLIYGLGYLISPRDYIGVYWITCLWYSFIYYYTYKTADIFLKNRLKSVLCAVLMTVAFFNPLFHVETRAEDFCLLFVTLSLYRTCLLLYSEEGKRLSSVYTTFIILGSCFSALLLIKYNIAALQLFFLLYALLEVWRKGLPIVKSLGFYIGGVMFVLFPFIVYFLVENNFFAFIKEYFWNTLLTIDNKEMNLRFGLRSNVILFISLVVSGFIFSLKMEKYKYFLLLGSILFFFLSIGHYLHYLNICSIFLIAGLIGVLSYVPTFNKKYVILASFLVILPVTYHMQSMTYAFRYKPFYFFDIEPKRHFDKISAIMNEYEQPTLINVMFHEFGYGIQAETLPGCKYWAYQNGTTPEMDKEHKNDVLSGKADFLYIYDGQKVEQEGITLSMLKELGYIVCYSWTDDTIHYLLKKESL